MEVRTFRDLLAWQRAMDFVEAVYAWTEGLPRWERFGLTSQLTRSAVSVPSNISEGWANGTTAMFVRRLRDARGSLAEAETQIEIGSRIHKHPIPARLSALREETGRLLQGLIASLERRLGDGGAE